MLKEIEDLGALFFTEEEVMEITELQELTPAGKKAHRTGALRAEAELRKSVMDLAKAGSSPAQAIAIRLMDSFNRKNY
jgi:hypothetical protein